MITQNEYELLKEYRRLGYKWIARDKNGRLFVYQEIPRRYRKTWNFGGVVVNIRGEYFTFIKWEDEKPTLIADLINDYESHQVIAVVNNVDKSELIKEIEEILDDIGVSDYQLGECDEDTIWTISSITIRKILSVIEKHSPVSVDETVKVTVPQFVADWIEEVKGTYTLKLLFANSDMPSSVEDWLYCNNENCEKMALAWIYGYEVEQEKLYTVRLANGSCLYRYVSVGIDWIKGPSDYRNDKDFHLTQTGIESVDPILMQIAEEVE